MTQNLTDAEFAAAIDRSIELGEMFIVTPELLASWVAGEHDDEPVEVEPAPEPLPEQRVEVLDRGLSVELHVVDELGRRIVLAGPSGRGAVTAELRRHAFAERVEHLRAVLAELPAVARRGYAVVGLDELAAAGPES